MKSSIFSLIFLSKLGVLFDWFPTTISIMCVAIFFAQSGYRQRGLSSCFAWFLLQIKVSVNRHTSNCCGCSKNTSCSLIGTKEIEVPKKKNTCFKLPENNMGDGRGSPVNWERERGEMKTKHNILKFQH